MILGVIFSHPFKRVETQIHKNRLPQPELKRMSNLDSFFPQQMNRMSFLHLS
jgi:hypothetical protein